MEITKPSGNVTYCWGQAVVDKLEIKEKSLIIHFILWKQSKNKILQVLIIMIMLPYSK